MGELREAQENLAELEAKAARLLGQRTGRLEELGAVTPPPDAPADDERRFDADAGAKRTALLKVLHAIDDEREQVQRDVHEARLNVQRVLNTRRLRWLHLQERRERWRPLLPFAADFAALADAIEPLRRKSRGYIPRDIDGKLQHVALWARNLAGKQAELDAVEAALREDGDEFMDKQRILGEPVSVQRRVLHPVTDAVEILEIEGERVTADLERRGLLDPHA